MTLIEACFIALTVLAALATYSIVEVSGYWLAKQRARDKREAEVRENGFE